MNTPISGGCACGAVRYESTVTPVVMLHCHCRDCQHSSGGPFASFVVVPKHAFRMTKGELRIHDMPSEGGGYNHRGFCENCASPIVSMPDPAPEIVAIRVGSLDEADAFQPQMDVWTCDVLPWTLMDPTLPKFDKYPG